MQVYCLQNTKKYFKMWDCILFDIENRSFSKNIYNNNIQIIDTKIGVIKDTLEEKSSKAASGMRPVLKLMPNPYTHEYAGITLNNVRYG